MWALQALKVLKEMHQRKAFTSLLGVSLAEAGKTNDKAQAAQMRSLDLSMHIAAGTLPDAWVVGQQVSDPAYPCTSPVLLAQPTVQGKHLGAAILCHTTMMFRKVLSGHMINPCAISYKCFAFLQLIEQHKKASLPSSSLAEVHLVMGNMKDDLGLFADAQQLWQEAVDMYQQECSALGIKERQVQFACCRLYGMHRCLIAAQTCNIKRRIDKQRIESQQNH